MSGLTELEKELLAALGDMLKLADEALENWSDEEIARHQKAAAIYLRAEAKAKEPQCVGGCVCDLQEVAKAHGQEAKVEPPCSDFAPLELHPDYCLFCEHARACHSSAVEG
jgi:hypothetical protein